MNKSTVNTKDGYTTIFCGNCGTPTEMGVPMERARQLAKKNETVHCDDCRPYVKHRDNAQAAVDHSTKRLEEIKARRKDAFERLVRVG